MEKPANHVDNNILERSEERRAFGESLIVAHKSFDRRSFLAKRQSQLGRLTSSVQFQRLVSLADRRLHNSSLVSTLNDSTA